MADANSNLMFEKELLQKLHKMTPKKLFAWFNRATPEEIEAVTQPCPGDAHTNPHIDYCLRCMNTKWGRVLKDLPKE